MYCTLYCIPYCMAHDVDCKSLLHVHSLPSLYGLIEYDQFWLFANYVCCNPKTEDSCNRTLTIVKNTNMMYIIHTWCMLFEMTI